jgi:23S rRNA (pseudouridine1915-N3)-methyltransferase
MKITVLAVGKIKDRMVAEKMAEYARRLGKGIKIDFEEVDDNPGSKAKEAENIIRRIPEKRARIIALDEKGRAVDSPGFASIISRAVDAGKDLVFILGGPYGLDGKVKQAADEVLALSRLTFPHELARLILVEQIYRAFSIIREEPYHK